MFRNILIIFLIMAYTCSGNSNKEMVQKLRQCGIIKTEYVFNAMLKTDRAFYAPMSPYNDNPIPIGHHQTISAPHMHAYALETMASIIKPAMSILDVGSGSGYLTACLARMVDKDSHVYGIETVSFLVEQSIKNIRKDEEDLIKSGKVTIIERDGWKGLEENAPFDFIHVGAAADEEPKGLIDQLKDGGKMVIPIGGMFEPQYWTEITRKGDSFIKNRIMGVRFVPLVKNE